jgi:prepilin-type N-terminal cleavage/methylation domain-containing protein
VTRHRQPRAGYTILELLVVIVIILIVGGIVAPSLLGLWGNNRTKAALDTVTARLAEARGAAIAHGVPYRVCVSPDGQQIRTCPDESDLAAQSESERPANPIDVTNTVPPGVTLTPMTVGGTASPDGWVTIITFLPDGTCREDAGELLVGEENETPQVVRVRGLTGVWTVNPATATEGTIMGMGMSP